MGRLPVLQIGMQDDSQCHLRIGAGVVISVYVFEIGFGIDET